MDRRLFLCTPLVLATAHARAAPPFAPVAPGAELAFPRDHGSHPLFRTEWWYITGWVEGAGRGGMGVQVTFFRSRPRLAEESVSRFAPKELLFAHAAIADPRLGRLRTDQRAARAGFGLAQASTATTDVAVGDWTLRLAGDTYETHVAARDFAFALRFAAPSLPILQGERGFSRKGPRDAQASYYYSRPQLATSGTVTLDGRTEEVRGTAWLDHEWSSEYLAAEAQGWDWTGINFADGGALMAFRIRAKDGGVLWAGGSIRDASGVARTLSPGDVRFTPEKSWRSPRTGIAYPVAMRVEAGGIELRLEPLMEDQELDARASVGTVYWEGAVRALAGDRVVGRGYLELSGYGGPLRI
ncbi:MAG: lipocalin-like domain-containing protein [Casimicrobiaceae bacterium]